MAEETPNPQIQNDWAGAFGAARNEATAGRTKSPKTPQKNQSLTDEQKRIQEIADELSNHDYWDGLVRAPADIMLAKTGRAFWDIPDKEIKKISVPLAFSAKTLISLDPRIMLLILLVSNIGTVYGPRVMQELNARKQEALDTVEKREMKT
jgi:hypothetical protein